MPDQSCVCVLRLQAGCVGRLAVALVVSAFSAGAIGAPRAIVDRSLGRSDVDLVGWDDTVILFHDELGRLREEPVGSIVAILPVGSGETRGLERPDDASLAGGTPVVVDLVDGQRLIGSMGPWDSFSVGADDLTDLPEAVALFSRRTGVRPVPLDRVSRIVVDPWSRGPAMPTVWTPGVDDEVVFRNGDRASGFVLEISGGVDFDDGDRERRFGLEQIAEIRLGNEPAERASARIWSREGEILDERSVGFDTDGAMMFAGADEPDADERGDEEGPVLLERSLREVLAANVSGDRLVPLASLERVEVRPGAGRRWTAVPRAGSLASAPLDTPHVVLPGPMRVEWRLPPDAERFGAIARLGGTLERPFARAGRWADAGVRVSVRTGDVDRLLFDGALERGSGAAPIAVELPGVGEIGRVLVVEITDGRYGPIQDSVLLDRPMLLLTDAP